MAPDAKQGRGCLFYGCLTTILIFVGVLLGIFFGTRAAVKYAVTTYTSTSPGQVPKLDLTPAEQARMAGELEQRAAAALRGDPPAPIALGEKELNVLIARTANFQPYHDQFYLQPSGTQLQAQVSLPLDQFALWRQFLQRLWAKDLSGRYFNGVAIVDPSVTNGALSLRITDLLVNGKSLPGDFTGRLKNFDLAARPGTNRQTESLLNRIESVAVRDGKVIVQPAPAPGSAP